MPEKESLGVRKAQRLETRERIYRAAIAEFKSAGTAEANIGKIVAAAGIARGTFYFHFPTKEHVLAELEEREEARMMTSLNRFLASTHDLASVLAEVVRSVIGTERRLGKTLFSDLLALHFTPTRPNVDPHSGEWATHSLIALLVREVELARERGEVRAGADPVQTAGFFMLGLYALLITTRHQTKATRSHTLANFVDATLRSVVPQPGGA